VHSTTFHEHEVLHRLKHFLPAQAPLKDFIHHNTLHAFQNISFQEALKQATEIFGYKTSLTIDEYRGLLASGKIKDEVLREIIISRKGSTEVSFWIKKLLHEAFDKTKIPRVGLVRAYWKDTYRLDLDSMVHPTLFRILCSYLDQGIAMWNFPVWHKGFLSSIREMERGSFTSFFKTKYVKQLLLDGNCGIEFLLDKLVGDPTLYEHYLYDQQFAHQGWSGMVSAIEDNPDTLLDHRKISIHDLISFELLLELDAVMHQLGKRWKPLGKTITNKPIDLFAEVPASELHEAILIFQEAYEWTYYNAVLSGLQKQEQVTEKTDRSFQAMFCIDDRECSIRRYLEKFDPTCQTFGTPGFFGVEFFYKPEHGKFLTKLCPAPVTPKYLIKEIEGRSKQQKDLHFTKQTHSLFRGWLITQTLGFWSAIKLFINIFRPSVSPATATSFRHMDKFSKLTIENHNPNHRENDLQVGFTIEEMANRVEGLLASIGLVKDFASIVYVVGHGSSSVNNPHFAAYDCGACSGRPGSVNARVICHMANHKQVRNILALRGIEIPDTTQFVGALHDTTRDEVIFFDEGSLSDENKLQHTRHEQLFSIALDHNAKERSRRFEIINSALSPEAVHDKVRLRSVSLFEPRPELNHATNALCIVGDRSLTRGLFLDRRAFLNSYDYRIDPQGKYLFSILKAAAPVCGGINLEYYFSRVDNQKLGAGTKLPHNVMGLFGVANGIDGDLRPGLPSQMIEVHDPIRLLIVVQHYPEVVLETIQRNAETYEWFINNWVNLAVMHPDTKEIFVFRGAEFHPHKQLSNSPDVVTDLELLVETHQENLPVYLIA
jgi:uncharacterized protein YbcC (UPF0753/DUF2309 family)